MTAHPPAHMQGVGTPALRPELTVARLFEETAAARPDAEAVVYTRHEEQGGELRWTYAEYRERALRTASALVASGIAPGERVAVYATNVPEFLLLQLGCAYANVVLVSLNPLYGASELEFAFARTQARMCFLVPTDRGRSLWDTMDAIPSAPPSELRIPVGPDPARHRSFAEWLEAATDADRAEVLRRMEATDPGAVSQFQLTSGTTAMPKVVRLTNVSLANQGRLMADRAQIDSSVRWVNPLPLFHCGGCVVTNLSVIAAGGCHVPVVKFDARRVALAIAEERATAVSAVPTMLYAIEEQLEREPADLSSLERVISGGSVVPRDLASRWRGRYGVAFVNTYGQTEHSPLATVTGPSDSDEDQVATCGLPLAHVEVEVVAPGTTERVARGEQGEVRFRGFVMDGYHDDPEATRRAVDDEGWLRSGDLGIMDGRGYLTITGRVKDMIIRGGENISPTSVEDALRELDEVLDAAVIGVPDAQYGEQICAYLRTTTGDDLAAEDVRRRLAGRVARFKLPSHVRVVDEFPLTPSGKVQKHVLREWFAGEPGTVPSR